MPYLKKKNDQPKFNFIKIPKQEFSLKRVQINSLEIDNNVSKYYLHSNFGNTIDSVINNLKKYLPSNHKIIPPFKNGQLVASTYVVKKINQTKIVNHIDYLEKPKIGNLCNCDFIVDRIYSFSNDIDTYRFKIKISCIEIIE